MSPSAESAPLCLAPRPSRQLMLFISLVHTGAVVISLMLPLAWAWQLVLLLLVLIHAGFSLWAQAWRRAPWSVRDARWDRHGWELELVNGRRLRAARLLPSSFIGQHLIVLNFALNPWQVRSLPLFADSLENDQMRQLRARLRAEGGNQHAKSQTLR